VKEFKKKHCGKNKDGMPVPPPPQDQGRTLQAPTQDPSIAEAIDVIGAHKKIVYEKISKHGPTVAIATDVNMKPAYEWINPNTSTSSPEVDVQEQFKQILNSIPEEHRSKVHDALVLQRTEDVKRFNIFVKKERMITLMSTLSVLRNRCHGCGIMFIIFFPFLAFVCLRCKRKRVYKQLKKLL
jgi:hypothetical protein